MSLADGTAWEKDNQVEPTPAAQTAEETCQQVAQYLQSLIDKHGIANPIELRVAIDMLRHSPAPEDKIHPHCMGMEFPSKKS